MESIATKSFLLLCYHSYLSDMNKSYTWRHVQTHKAYAFISATQPKMTTNERYKFQYQLFIDAIRTFHCQAVSLLGGFVETDYLNRIDCRDELSVFIRDISLSDAINLGIKYHQDYILYSDGITPPAIYLTSKKHGIVGDLLVEFEGKELTDIQDAVKCYFSRLTCNVLRPDFSSTEPIESHFRMFENRNRSAKNELCTWRMYAHKIL